jgi:hypothetical protein
MLPELLAVLARIMCWKERRTPNGRIPTGEEIDVDFERELEYEANPILHIPPETNWDRLDMVFHATVSAPPYSRPLFTILYYLYPSNTLRFLQGPVQYLVDCNTPSPYVETWAQALDQNEVRRRSEVCCGLFFLPHFEVVNFVGTLFRF